MKWILGILALPTIGFILLAIAYYGCHYLCME